MTWRIALGAVVIVLLLSLLAVLGAGFWVYSTPAGTRWSFQQIERYAGPAVQVTGAAGTWSSAITLDEFRYRDESREILLTDVSVQLSLWRLSRRELFVEHLEIGDLSLRFTDDPVAEPEASRGDLVVPLEIVLVRGSVDRLILRGETDAIVEHLELSGVWGGRRLTVAQVSGSFQGIDAQADGSFVLTDPIGLSASVAWTTDLDDGRQFIGQADVDGNLNELSVSHELLAPFSIVTAGRITLGAEPRVDLVSTSNEISYPLGERRLTLSNSRLALSGWLDAYRAEIDGSLATQDLPAVQLSGSGSGNASSFQTDTLDFSFARGRIQIAGRLGWADAIQWALDVVLTDVDPSELFPEWPGALSGGLSVNGSRSAGGLELEANNIAVSGHLRGQPIELAGRARTDGALISLDSLRLSSGRNYVAVEGTYGEQIALQYATDIRDLTILGEGWEGAITASGVLRGTVAAPELEIAATARGLRLLQVNIEQLTVSGRLKDNDSTSLLTVVAGGVNVQERAIDRIQAQARGALQAHQMEVNIVAGADSLSARFKGGWSVGQWRGQLVDSLLTSAQWGTWEQALPADLVLANAQVQASKLCWSDNGAALCLAGGFEAGALQVAGQLDNIDLQPLRAFLPEGSAVRGALGGDFTISGNLDSPALSFAARAASIDLLYSFAADEETLETALRDLVITGEGDPNHLKFELKLSGMQESSLALSAEVSDWRQPEARVRGRLEASLPDVAFLSLLYTEVSDWAGSAEADLSVQGSLQAPQVTGFVRLRNGRALVRRAGIALENIRLDVQPAAGNRLGVIATAKSGEGQIRVDGGIELDGNAGWPLYGTITGARFTALRLPGIDVVVSPDVSISGSRNTIRLKGQVVAPRAIVELKELPEQAIELSPDVTVHRVAEAAPDRKQPLQFYTDLTLVLGKEVRFSGFGLRTDLAGQLALHSGPNRPMEGRGVVNLTSGRFQAYGQNLEIQNGTLLFDGPLDDPTLNVEAVRRVDSVTVGVRVRGSGRDPQASIFSRPAMSEADALSYLVIGRPLAQATSAEGASLKNSAVALGLKQAMPITDQLGQAVGLDELGLDPDNVDTGAVMAGKQISSDLYVRYSYGLFSRLGALLLRYRLNNRLSLEARSSEDQSLDLIYSRERK